MLPQLPQQIRIKQGDTFFVEDHVVDDDTGEQVDLTNVTVISQVWNKGVKVADLVLEWIDRAHGIYELWAPGDATTQSWPLGNLRMDIQFTEPAGPTRLLRRSTETIYLLVEEDVSQ